LLLPGKPPKIEKLRPFSPRDKLAEAAQTDKEFGHQQWQDDCLIDGAFGIFQPSNVFKAHLPSQAELAKPNCV